MRGLKLVIVVAVLSVFSLISLVARLPKSVGNSEVRVTEKTENQEVVVGGEIPPEVAYPEKLIIPKLNVRANVESVGEDDSGRMDVPKDDLNVAWWKYGAKPGGLGNAVLAGHLDTKIGDPAVFYELNNLEVGDEITVKDIENNTLTFIVSAKEIYIDDSFPLDEVFGATDKTRLNLITCTGYFDRGEKNYSDRLVVYSELKEK